MRRSNLLLSARGSLALVLREVLVMWWERSEESLRLIKTEVEQFVVMLDVLNVGADHLPNPPLPSLALDCGHMVGVFQQPLLHVTAKSKKNKRKILWSKTIRFRMYFNFKFYIAFWRFIISFYKAMQ